MFQTAVSGFKISVRKVKVRKSGWERIAQAANLSSEGQIQVIFQ